MVGAYVQGITDNQWEFLENICIDTNANIIIPDYPLTPKYTYEDVFNMIVPLYKEIINYEEIIEGELILMGDSAGGGMALALVEKLNEENIMNPNKTILISPWLDVTLGNPLIDEIQPFDKELNKETLKIAGIAYSRKKWYGFIFSKSY